MTTIVNKIYSIWNLFRLALSGGESNILNGNINRAILLLAIPMTLEMAMESLFAVVDIYFVSKIGINAIAAVGLTETIMTIPIRLDGDLQWVLPQWFPGELVKRILTAPLYQQCRQFISVSLFQYP